MRHDARRFIPDGGTGLRRYRWRERESHLGRDMPFRRRMRASGREALKTAPEATMIRNPVLVILWVCLGLLVWATAPMAREAGEEAQSRVRFVHANRDGQIFRLDIQVDLVLTPAARNALLNGVPLVFDLEIHIQRERAWWPNVQVADLDQKFRLTYHAISRQFLVENLNTGVQETYPSLKSALEGLGRVQDFPLIDATLLNPAYRYVCAVRARLDVDRLPIPLMVRSYLSNDWAIRTGWYTVRLT